VWENLNWKRNWKKIYFLFASEQLFKWTFRDAGGRWRYQWSGKIVTKSLTFLFETFKG
jgi:hypothetical protein